MRGCLLFWPKLGAGAGAVAGSATEAEAAVSMATLTGPLTLLGPITCCLHQCLQLHWGGSGAAQLSAQFGADCQQEGVEKLGGEGVR